MAYIDDIREYIKTHDSNIIEVYDENGNYKFEKKIPFTEDIESLAEIIIDKNFYTATIRVYVGNYFVDFPSDDLINFAVNKLNQEFRFGSFYSNSDSLIVEQDLLITTKKSVPPLIDYLMLLISVTETVLEETILQ